MREVLCLSRDKGRCVNQTCCPFTCEIWLSFQSVQLLGINVNVEGSWLWIRALGSKWQLLFFCFQATKVPEVRDVTRIERIGKFPSPYFHLPLLLSHKALACQVLHCAVFGESTSKQCRAKQAYFKLKSGLFPPPKYFLNIKIVIHCFLSQVLTLTFEGWAWMIPWNPDRYLEKELSGRWEGGNLTKWDRPEH